MKLLTVGSLLLFLSCWLSAADCWKNVQPGQHSQELNCLYFEWKNSPDREQLIQVLHTLFYVYVTDGSNLAMRSFFDGMRKDDPLFADARALREELIRKYSFDDPTPVETASLWAMSPWDARLLFVLSQIDPASLPRDIACAMQLAIYDEIERFFNLNAARRLAFGILPATEYLRLQEILHRMAWIYDPFLQATNLYYRGIVWMNLGGFSEGISSVKRSRELLAAYLSSTKEKLSRRRILRSMAAADVVLGELQEAELDYISILKIDPQDWTAMMELSYVLNKRGECNEPAIWIEASIKSDQELFDVVIHCGSRELPDETFPTEAPVIAQMNGHAARFWDDQKSWRGD